MEKLPNQYTKKECNPWSQSVILAVFAVWVTRCFLGVSERLWSLGTKMEARLFFFFCSLLLSSLINACLRTVALNNYDNLKLKKERLRLRKDVGTWSILSKTKQTKIVSICDTT